MRRGLLGATFLLGTLGFARTEGRTNVESVHSVPLGSEADFHWRIDWTKEIVEIEVHYYGEEDAWFAIGFSDYGETKPADYCVIWLDWRRNVRLQDTWATIDGKIRVDERQDCRGFASRKIGNLTKFTFARKFDTCDKFDYIIERGTTHVVWLKGRGPLYSLAGLATEDASSSGMTRIELLRRPTEKPKFPTDTWRLDVLNDRVRVPNVETTYWCRVIKLPDTLRRRHHVLQFGPKIDEGNEHLVHHMEVFHCAGPPDLEIPLYSGPCRSPERPEKTKVCRKVLAAWAMGADPFVYPGEVGLPIGGDGFNPYVVLEVHYNNPEFASGRVDSSGVRLYLTESLREFDAGIIELGLEYTDKMAIPPLQESFELSGHCTAECTGIGLPASGIRVFASQLHTHLTGRRVVTRHARDGREIEPLNYDNHYSTHFQEIRLLPKRVTVLPGDSLVTTCAYETTDRTNVTLGGFAITDEMCINYIHYYPKARLEVCKSAISDDALRTYFRYMREWEDQDTRENNGIAANYASVEWNRVRAMALRDLYAAAPLGMQCNGSDGSRLPGLWDNVAATPISLPLPPPARDCTEPRNAKRRDARTVRPRNPNDGGRSSRRLKTETERLVRDSPTTDY